MPLKSSTIPESSILSCLDLHSPGKVLNSDKKEFLDIAAHIPNTPHETLILVEMILNNSSLQLIDNGKHRYMLGCRDSNI
jgi:hypothetical protein